MKIAVDGFSAAGKSTVSKELADALDILYLDTGAMYRAAALKAHRNGVDIHNNEALRQLIASTSIDVVAGKIFLDGEDVSVEIRQHFMSKLASDISAIKEIRLFLVEIQRRIAAKTDCILDGRDIGTFVFPDADFKFYLTASLEERARRRYLELLARGQECNLRQIEDDIALRDKNDTEREFAPLRKADDAIEIDSTSMTIEKVVEKMLNVIKKAHK